MRASSYSAENELADALAALLRLLRPPTGSGLLAMFDETDLTPSQLKALFTLVTEPAALPVKTLAERVKLSDAAMSRAVDGMVERGLVARTRHERDGRARAITATAAGRELARRMETVRYDNLVTFARGLSAADRERLTRAILPVIGSDAGSTSDPAEK